MDYEKEGLQESIDNQNYIKILILFIFSIINCIFNLMYFI